MVGGIGFLGSSFTFSETKPFIQIANDQIAKESTLPSSSSYEMKALFCPDLILLSKEEDGNITSLLLFFHGEHTRTFTCIAGGKGCRSRFKPVYQYYL